MLSSKIPLFIFNAENGKLRMIVSANVIHLGATMTAEQTKDAAYVCVPIC